MKNQLPDAACRTPVFAAPQNAAEQPKTTAENAALPQSAPVPDAPPSAPVPGGSRTAGGLALLFSAVLGYLYVRLLLFTGTVGASLFWPGPLAFTLLFAAAVGVWARQSAARLRGEGLLWLGCALTAAAALTFVRLNAVPQGLAVLFWHGAALYGVLACTGQLTEGRTGPFCAADLLRGVGMGFAGLAAWPRDLLRWLCSRPAKGGRPRRSAAPAVGCVAVSAVLLCLAASWLGRADAGFAALLQSIAFWNNGFWQGKWLGQTVFCLAVGLPVFLWAGRDRQRAAGQPPAPRPAAACGAAGAPALCFRTAAVRGAGRVCGAVSAVLSGAGAVPVRRAGRQAAAGLYAVRVCAAGLF